MEPNGESEVYLATVTLWLYPDDGGGARLAERLIEREAWVAIRGGFGGQPWVCRLDVAAGSPLDARTSAIAEVAATARALHLSAEILAAEVVAEAERSGPWSRAAISDDGHHDLIP